jgi:hypothetical protein
LVHRVAFVARLFAHGRQELPKVDFGRAAVGRGRAVVHRAEHRNHLRLHVLQRRFWAEVLDDLRQKRAL